MMIKLKQIIKRNLILQLSLISTIESNNSSNAINSNNEFTEIPVDEILEDGVIMNETPSAQQLVIIGWCEACIADIYDVQSTSITMDGYTVHSRCYGYLHQCTSCSDVYFAPLPGEGTCAKCTTICSTCGINFAIAPYMNGQCADCYYACNKCGKVDPTTFSDSKHYCSTCKYDCIICGENYSWTGREPHGKCLICILNGR